MEAELASIRSQGLEKKLPEALQSQMEAAEKQRDLLQEEVHAATRSLRELREELGVTLPADALQECGVRHFTFEDVFHGRLFKDNQVSKVFCLWLDKNAEDFTVQKEEIDYVRWFGLEEAIEAVKNNTIPNCIYLEELEMVAAATR